MSPIIKPSMMPIAGASAVRCAQPSMARACLNAMASLAETASTIPRRNEPDFVSVVERLETLAQNGKAALRNDAIPENDAMVDFISDSIDPLFSDIRRSEQFGGSSRTYELLKELSGIASAFAKDAAPADTAPSKVLPPTKDGFDR